MTYPIHRTPIICLTFLIGLVCSSSVSALPRPVPLENVALTAWMDITDGTLNDIIVEVNVNGVKDWGRPDADGRVDLMLPSDAVALIHFRKPGHLTKTVTVDTHNMRNGSFKGKKHSLSFSVKLDPVADKEDLAYSGLVGTIFFDAVSGDPVIEQDQHLAPIRQQKVVF